MPGLDTVLRRLPHGLSRGLPQGAPRQCEVCLAWARDAICADCVTRWAAPLPRCARCGLRLGQPAAACGNCLRQPPPFEHTFCAVDYAFPWDHLVGRFKFNGQVELAAALATRVLAAAKAAAAPPPQLLLPVPLSAARLAERGYNQAWELARRMAARLRVAGDPALLLRPLDTAQQADLDRAQRQRNLRTAFMVDARRRAEVAGRRVALVDDVMTTGATAREAAAVLLRAGAAAVDVWVLARTPA
jgi:ComF family protein